MGSKGGGGGGGAAAAAEVVVMLTHNFTMALDHFSGSSSCSEDIFLSPSNTPTLGRTLRGAGLLLRQGDVYSVCVCVLMSECV